MDIEKELIERSRTYSVYKSNTIVQKARFDLSIVEQKTIAYLVSMIKPKTNPLDKPILEYNFNIRDYCKICGKDYDNGGNYNYIKKNIKKLSDKSIWVMKEDGSETLLRWVFKATIVKKSGIIKIIIDEDMVPYLFDLKDRFLQYELYNALILESKYALRLYEILKSYTFAKRKSFDVDELKKMLMLEHIKSYKNFSEFRRSVLDIAIREINENTDIDVSYELQTKGNKVIRVIFELREKKMMKKIATYNNVVNTLDKKDDDTQINI